MWVFPCLVSSLYFKTMNLLCNFFTSDPFQSSFIVNYLLIHSVTRIIFQKLFSFLITSLKEPHWLSPTLSLNSWWLKSSTICKSSSLFNLIIHAPYTLLLSSSYGLFFLPAPFPMCFLTTFNRPLSFSTKSEFGDLCDYYGLDF